jgi:hypothetical protein
MRIRRLSIVFAAALLAAALASRTESAQQVVNVIVATTCSASNWVSAISATGSATCARPAASDVSGLAAIASSGSASDLSAGTLPAGRFPALTGDVTTVAGALAATIATAQPAVHTWALAQTFTVAPVFTDASGSRTALGLATVASSASAADLSTGTLPAGRMPALTGDVTTSAGAVATVVGNLPTGVTVAGSLLATNIAAPSTPASGKTSLYVDSTNKVFSSKNDAGTVSVTVVPKAATTNQFVTAVSAAGVVAQAQPAFTDVSGSVAAAQMPALTGDITTSAGAVATTIASNAVTNAKSAQMANSTVKCRTTAGTGNPEDCTAAQTAAIVGTVGGALLSKVVNATFDLSTATGTTNVTGFGFNPTSLSITYAINGGLAGGTGFLAGSVMGTTAKTTNAGTTTVASSGLILYWTNDAGTTSQQCTASFITDGYALACTKTGSPTGSLLIVGLGAR